jgi:glycine oxidase
LKLLPVQSLIVGGGVIGLSVAWELAQRGQKVSLLDAQAVGQGASWAGAGILPAAARQAAVDPYEQLRSLSHAAHPDWAQRLRELTGIDTGFQRCGGVYLARSSAEAATLAANRGWWEEHGIENQVWSLDELRQREPDLFERLVPQSAINHLRGIWFLPDECQLRNPRHLQALAAACRLSGVELIENSPVKAVKTAPQHRLLVITEQHTYQADQVCICSGAWARQTLLQLGISTGIMPVRGQMVLYRTDRPLLNSIINEGHRYLVARRDGHLLAGSLEEEVGYEIQTTVDGISQIRQWAEGIMPALKHHKVERTWAGLRPGSFDGLPYLGAVPGIENLYLAAGHYRSGLHLSCATATLMANVMLGVDNPVDLYPFRVGRG